MYKICPKCQEEFKTCNSKVVHCSLSCAKKGHKNGMTGKIPWNKGLTKEDHPGIARQSLIGRKAEGCFAWSTEERSAHAKKTGLGGYNKNAGRSKKFIVKDSFGKQTHLQSSYELQCANLLNEMKINWLRPTYLRYGEKKYFPDFYLPEYDVYLDPKNDYLAKLDAVKIAQVIEENNVVVHILSEKQLTAEALDNIIKT